MVAVFVGLLGGARLAESRGPGPAETEGKRQLSGWGTMVNGMECRVTVPTALEQGMPLAVSLELRADPSKLAPGVRQLNTFLPAAFVELSLTPAGGGDETRVRPEDPTLGMPAADTGRNGVALDSKPLAPLAVTFPLVRVRDALPPGDYECRVNYTFAEKPTGWWRGTEAEWRKAGFWHGRVVSAPFTLRVEAETPKTRTFLLPRRLRLVKGLSVVFRKDDAEEVTLPVRNGYHLGMRIDMSGGGMRLSGPMSPDDSNSIDQWPADTKGDRTVRYAVELFETADPPCHFWMPRPGSGGYKTLWKKTLTVSATAQEIHDRR
jgi:hypothetical protein